MKTIINPDFYHGSKKTTNFFEGWYFKVVDKNNLYKFALIPGIALDDNTNSSHSFIQIVDGYNIAYDYIKFKPSDFNYDNTKDIFSINVATNSFSLDSVNLNLVYINKSNKKRSIKGNLKFTNIFKWKDNAINPGSMGFYNYLTFMECYSQVCALDGDIIGKLNICGQEIDFTGGKVYIEKNWGKSFPKSWLWVQSNNFEQDEVSVTCSLATIPFPLKDFRGFLIGLRYKDKFYNFSTINRSKLILNKLDKDMSLVVSNKNLKLSLKTHTNEKDFVLCYGPKNGTMVPLVKETLNATVDVLLEDTKSNSIIFEGLGLSTGVEYGGDKLHIID